MAKATALRDMSISQLEKLVQAKKLKLVELVQKRDKMRIELSLMDVRIEELGGDTLAPEERVEAPRRRGRPKGSGNKTGTGKKRRGRIKGQKSLRTYVAAEMEKTKGGMTLEEAIAAVFEAGYKTKSDKFEHVMYQCLYHNFQKDADSGKWVMPSE